MALGYGLDGDTRQTQGQVGGGEDTVLEQLQITLDQDP
jgi:hypothetical protein